MSGDVELFQREGHGLRQHETWVWSGRTASLDPLTASLSAVGAGTAANPRAAALAGSSTRQVQVDTAVRLNRSAGFPQSLVHCRTTRNSSAFQKGSRDLGVGHVMATRYV
jgi:hypothetical protein